MGNRLVATLLPNREEHFCERVYIASNYSCEDPARRNRLLAAMTCRTTLRSVPDGRSPFLEQQPDRFFDAPRSLELYTSVLNNPVNMTDPYGLFIFALIALVVVGFVVGVAAHAINAAVSGGSFQWSEALMAGLMGALTFGLVGGLLGIGAVIIVGAPTRTEREGVGDHSTALAEQAAWRGEGR